MITIVADTLSCLSVEKAKELGIPYLPQIIIFGNTSYRDDSEIDSKTFIAKLRASSELPKTAAPPPALYTPIFSEFSKAGDTIIVICPSAELSGTYRSAKVAAQDFPEADIRIIDVKTVSSGLGSIVLEAHNWIRQGLSPDQVVKQIEEMAERQRVYFLVDTLEYLYKGGRIGGAKALMGGILQVKPILTLQKSLIQPFESQRTKHRALARLKELANTQCPLDGNGHLSVMHGGAEEEASNIAKEFAITFGHEIPVYYLPPAILVHSGPGALGISFFVKKT
jgi:DegV family protein with EDD domain